MTWIYGEEKSFTTVTKPWLNGWDYRKSHEIIGSTTSAVTDYQVKHVLDIFSALPENAATYQTTPTSDGSGQCVHPSILYFPDGWHGYKYWMAMTPYPGGNDDYETPEILVSDDGVNWSVPTGLTNPIVDRDAAAPNTDPCLFYNEATDELWVYYRKTDGATYDRIYLKKSSDGIDWGGTGLGTLLLDLGSSKALSPSVVKVGDTYHMWYVDATASPNLIKHRTSSDGENWGAEETCNLYGTMPSGKEPWHLEVRWMSEYSEYWMLLIVGNIGTTGHAGVLVFARSKDAINWYLYPNVVLNLGTSGAWDDTIVYKSTFILDGATLYIWYSAMHDPGHIWHVGYTATTLNTDFLEIFNKVRTDGGDLRFTNSDAVTELDYWIEQFDYGGYAVVWVKVPYIPALHPKVETGTWIVDGYTYHRRTKITITENSGQNLTDYQVKVVIDTKWLVDNGYATANGNEVRFTDSEGNLLNFWRETDFNLEETVYWVKIPSLPANTTKTIYIYYDEELTTVPNASDGEATFDFFDDFDLGYLDTDKWVEFDSGGTYAFVDSCIYLKPVLNADNAVALRSKLQFTYNIEVQAKIIPETDTYYDLGLVKNENIITNKWHGYEVDNIGYWLNAQHQTSTENTYMLIRRDVGSSTKIMSSGYKSPVQYELKYILRYLNNGNIRGLGILPDGTEWFNIYGTDTTYLSDLKYIVIWQGAYSGGQGGYSKWDWIFVRKYVEPEPSVEVEIEGQTTIYIYYGNPSATTTSNGKETFVLFDDFDDGVIDEMWSFQNLASYQETGGALVIEANAYTWENFDTGAHATLPSELSGYHAWLDMEWIARSSDFAHIGMALKSVTTFIAEVGMGDAWANASGQRRAWAEGGESYGSGEGSEPSSGRTIVEIYHYGNTYKFYYGGALILTGSGSSSFAEIVLFNMRYQTYNGKTAKFHLVRIRKYIDPEPSHGAWGVEESI